MKYRVLYNTQINNEFKAKDDLIEFPKGTDEGYILSLLRNKVIEEDKQDPQNVITNDESDNQEESEETKSSKKAKNK